MDAFVLKDSVTGGMTDAEFLRFCLENKDLRIERNSNLEIIIMSPTFTLSGFYSGEVFAQLSTWNRAGSLGIVFDSSTGFTLPDRSVFSPDASWLSRQKWEKLSFEDKHRFAPVCPEFVIEVRSTSDRIEKLKEKMEAWITNGTQLAWLIDPHEMTSYIFRPDRQVEEINGLDKEIKGEGPVEGFVLYLSRLKI